MTRKEGGILHLRIDDIDPGRVRPEYLEDIFRLLNWLEIDWDFGPSGPTDFFQNYRMIDKIEIYKKYLERTDQIYKCYCSRKNLIHDCHCETQVQPKMDLFNLKAKIPSSPIVWKKNGFPSYHLMSVVEDELAGCTLITRGEDLRESGIIQLKLSQLLKTTLGSAEFVHHGLVLDPEGKKKLSKSTVAQRVQRDSKFLLSKELKKKCLGLVYEQLYGVIPTDLPEKISQFLEIDAPPLNLTRQTSKQLLQS